MVTIEKVTDMLTSVASGSPKNQYTLIIDGIDASAGLSVLSIEEQASLNQPWRYDITFTTSNKQMAIDAVLSQAASLTFEIPSPISQIAASFGYQFPYCGEVGYKMTTIPPTPLMSNSEPFRPSYWSVSKYQMIYREYREANIYGDPQ